MSQRLNYQQQSPELFKKFADFSLALNHASIEAAIHDLVNIRASQLNGCAFCLDMHVKEAKLHGERDLRVHHVAIWRESPLFTPKERAALAWTETLTNLDPKGVPDEAYAVAREQFPQEELAELTFRVVAINGWNRLNCAFRSVPGSFDKMFGLDKAGMM